MCRLLITLTDYLQEIISYMAADSLNQSWYHFAVSSKKKKKDEKILLLNLYCNRLHFFDNVVLLLNT